MTSTEETPLAFLPPSPDLALALALVFSGLVAEDKVIAAEPDAASLEALARQYAEAQPIAAFPSLSDEAVRVLRHVAQNFPELHAHPLARSLLALEFSAHLILRRTDSHKVALLVAYRAIHALCHASLKSKNMPSANRIHNHLFLEPERDKVRKGAYDLLLRGFQEGFSPQDGVVKQPVAAAALAIRRHLESYLGLPHLRLVASPETPPSEPARPSSSDVPSTARSADHAPGPT